MRALNSLIQSHLIMKKNPWSWSCLSIVFTFNADCKLTTIIDTKKILGAVDSVREKNYYKNADIQKPLTNDRLEIQL